MACDTYIKGALRTRKEIQKQTENLIRWRLLWIVINIHWFTNNNIYATLIYKVISRRYYIWNV